MARLTCWGRKSWFPLGFTRSSSGIGGAICNTGRSGTMHKQQQGPQKQQMGSGQPDFLPQSFFLSDFLEQEDSASPEQPVLAVQIPLE